MSVLYPMALVLAICCSTGAQLCFKSGALRAGGLGSSLVHPMTLTGYGLFLVVTLLSVFVMQEFDLKTVNAWNGLIYLQVMVASVVLFGEKLKRCQIIGSVFILAGVFIFFMI